jgi:hypothetical protein
MKPPNETARYGVEGRLEPTNAVATQAQLQRLKLKRRVFDLAQRPLGYLFWYVESRRAQVQDQIANIEADLA